MQLKETYMSAAKVVCINEKAAVMPPSSDDQQGRDLFYKWVGPLLYQTDIRHFSKRLKHRPTGVRSKQYPGEDTQLSSWQKDWYPRTTEARNKWAKDRAAQVAERNREIKEAQVIWPWFERTWNGPDCADKRELQEALIEQVGYERKKRSYHKSVRENLKRIAALPFAE